METTNQNDQANINADVQKSQQIEKQEEKKIPYLKYGIILGAFLLMTLPFHYVPSHLIIFPKDNFTFSNTFIIQSDIDESLDKYNRTNFLGKMTMLNEPLFKKLKEKGLIYFKDDPSLTNNVSDQFNNQNANETNISNTQEEQASEEYSEDDKKIIEKIKTKVKRDYPNDFSVQKMLYDQGVADYLYLKTVTDLTIKKKLEREYPLDYSVQKMLYDQEVTAKEQMK